MEDDFLIKVTFKTIEKKMEYLRKTIDILVSTYNNNFKRLDDGYRQTLEEYKKVGKYNRQYSDELDMTHGELLESIYPDIFKDLDNFSNTILESMIIKHISYIERHIVELSFIIQKKENIPVPPDYNIRGHFTDKLKAVEYIKLVTNGRLRIQDINEWKMIVYLRRLRHSFAHGETLFELKHSIIDEINSKLPIIKKMGEIDSKVKSDEVKIHDNTKYWCCINADFEQLITLNKLCNSFINNVEKEYYKIYDAAK